MIFDVPDGNSILYFLSAALNAYAVYKLSGISEATAITKEVTEQTRIVSLETKTLALKTELNTNSMKDALVAATEKSAHAAGVEQGRGESAAVEVAKKVSKSP